MKVKFCVYPYWGRPRYFVSNVKSIEEAKKTAEKIAAKSNVEQCGYEVVEDGERR